MARGAQTNTAEAAEKYQVYGAMQVEYACLLYI